MTHAAAADLQTLDQLKSGGTSRGGDPISARDFALSVSHDLPLKMKLWSRLEHFDDQNGWYHTTVRWAGATVCSRCHTRMTVLRIVLMYSFIAVLTSMACPLPSSQSVDTVASLSISLRIFAAVLLGLFVFISVSIWHKCLSGFRVLFEAIQHLQMQFISFECADTENARTTMRYGLLSAHLLNAELCSEARGGGPWKQALFEMRAQISIPMGEETKCGLLHFDFLRDKELEILQGVDDASGMLWVWVASLLGSMAQDGSIPSMESSTFGHIVSLAQSAREGIHQARFCTTGQTAPTCMRALAVAVQASNLVSAVSLGIFLRACVPLSMEGMPTRIVAAELDLQAILVAIFLGVCLPVLYQVSLEAAVLLAVPFASKHEEVPTNGMISRLEFNLSEASALARQWQQPNTKTLPAQ